MGMHHTCCSHVTGLQEQIREQVKDRDSANPDPYNFKVIKVEKLNEYHIMEVNYPNCTNFKGNKILVFEGLSDLDIINMKSLDPHFNEDSYLIARFAPSSDGWDMAVTLCESL